MVLKGTVHILKEDYYGNKVLLSYANRGDLFGESFSFQQKTVSQVSFQAATDVDVLLMPLAKLLNTCSNSCPFHQQLVRNLFRQFAEKNAALMDKINISNPYETFLLMCMLTPDPIMTFEDVWSFSYEYDEF